MSEIGAVMLIGIIGMIFAFVSGWALRGEIERTRRDQEP